MKKLARFSVLAALLLSPAQTVRPTRALAEASAARTVEVVVEGAFRPSRITVAAGEPVRLRFVRRDYGPCTREVVFPTLGIRRTLPTNEPVVVELPALDPGEYEIRCGMNMIRATLVVASA